MLDRDREGVNLMTTAGRLAELMKEANITSAKQLAVLSKVSQTMISKILRGESSPTVTTIEMLCAALNVTPSEFFASIDESEDDEVWALREELRQNPELNMLFSTAKNATKADILKTVKILKTLKGED